METSIMPTLVILGIMIGLVAGLYKIFEVVEDNKLTAAAEEDRVRKVKAEYEANRPRTTKELIAIERKRICEARDKLYLRDLGAVADTMEDRLQ